MPEHGCTRLALLFHKKKGFWNDRALLSHRFGSVKYPGWCFPCALVMHTTLMVYRGKLKKVEKAEEHKSGGNEPGQARPELDNFSPGQKMKHDGTADTGPQQGPRLDGDAETAVSRAPGDMLDADAMAPNHAQQHAQARSLHHLDSVSTYELRLRGFVDAHADGPLLSSVSRQAPLHLDLCALPRY